MGTPCFSALSASMASPSSVHHCWFDGASWILTRSLPACLALQMFEQPDGLRRRHLKAGEILGEKRANIVGHALEELFVGLVDEMVLLPQRVAVGHPHADVLVGADDRLGLRFRLSGIAGNPAVQVLHRGRARSHHLEGGIERVVIGNAVAHRDAGREPQLERRIGYAELDRR